MRTTIDLPDDLFRQAKAQAALDGTSLKDLMTRFVEQGLRKMSGTRSSRTRRSPIPVARAATGRPIPAMSNSELYRLLDEEDAERNAVD